MDATLQAVRICDGGKPVEVTWAEALAFHHGNSPFGLAIAFRMLQAAGEALSQHQLWNRDELFVVSGHPGAGVRDAVECVTGCVSRGRYRVDGADDARDCGPAMRFDWEIGDGREVVALRLRDDFVPVELFALLERRNTPRQIDGDPARLAVLKQELAGRVWEESLALLFELAWIESRVASHA